MIKESGKLNQLFEYFMLGQLLLVIVLYFQGFKMGFVDSICICRIQQLSFYCQLLKVVLDYYFLRYIFLSIREVEMVFVLFLVVCFFGVLVDIRVYFYDYLEIVFKVKIMKKLDFFFIFL